MKRMIIALGLSLGMATVASAQTFSLERMTIRFNDGTIVDSANNDSTVSGSLSIAGGAATRTENLCVSGVCDSFSQTVTLQGFHDNQSAVVVRDNGNGAEFVLTIIERNPLILLEQTNNGVIVQRWVNTNKASEAAGTDDSTAAAPLPTPVIIEAMSILRRE